MKLKNKKDFLFKIWEELKNRKKTFYVITNWGITDESVKSEQLEGLGWEDVELLLDDIAKEIENENKTIEENSGN